MIKPSSITLSSTLKRFKTLVVVGGNWGDEGKGKIIDLVMKEYDIVARFSGGANAGHTVYTPEGVKVVSHLIPCGLAQNKICVLSRGEFFNVELFLKELEETRAVLKGQLPDIYIDEQAAVWTPYHRLFEAYIEIMRGENKIGTTNKGIGPLEGLYKLRLAPVVGNLFDPGRLSAVLQALYNVLKPCWDFVKASGQMPENIPSPEEVLAALTAQAEKIKEYVTDTSFFLHQQLQNGKRVLFEGAQATGLDAWWGTYPYVSSGNSVAAGAALGTGLPMDNFRGSIMVAKVLPTRVGRGPFPSEMWERELAMAFAKEHPKLYVAGAERDEFLKSSLEKINSGNASGAEMSQYFQVLGDERGATTGRGRSVGYLDIPWLQYAIRINNPSFLALTRFDMLSGVKAIPIITAYKLHGELLPQGKIPPSWRLAEVEALKENWECWTEDISGYNDFNKLPKSAQDFISKLEKLLKVPILLVGTGPKRDAIIVRG